MSQQVFEFLVDGGCIVVVSEGSAAVSGVESTLSCLHNFL